MRHAWGGGCMHGLGLGGGAPHACACLLLACEHARLHAFLKPCQNMHLTAGLIKSMCVAYLAQQIHGTYVSCLLLSFLTAAQAQQPTARRVRGSTLISAPSAPTASRTSI